MTTRLLLVPLILILPARALVPGAWESFSTQTNADAWTLYDYNDQQFYYPGWSDGADPFIGGTMTAFSQYYFADASVAAGAFTGDYAAAGVQSITMDVYMSDPSLIDYFDVAVYSEAGAEPVYYYTDSFFGTYFTESGWYALEFSFADPWYYVIGTEWQDVMLSAAELSNITEIGITFFHVDTNTDPVEVGIDNVSLNHALLTPELEVSAASGEVSLSFQLEPAHIYALESFNTGSQSWEGVAGQGDVLGPNPFVFTTPAAGSKLYRCVAEPYYTEVMTAP